MLVRMPADAPQRSADRPRTLVCNREGVWLWPGTPLTERRGGTISALPKSTIYDRITKLHGPAAIYSMVVPCVDHAAALLPDGQVERAQESLDRARLPLVTPDELESDANKVRIPYYKHRDISDFYDTPNDKYDDLSPRKYPRGKSWNEQYQFGLDTMRNFGVLK